MTEPDTQPPVYLPEPERPREPPRAEAPPPPPQGRRHIHPDWEPVIAPDETVLWDGKPEPRAGLSGGNRNLVLLAIFGIFLFAAATSDSPIPVFIGIAAFVLFRKKTQRNVEIEGRNYLLTNRAAYIAVSNGARLRDIRAFPITESLRLGLGPRSVAFASKFGRDGKEEAEGFLDIPDAQRVHDLIRDIQKAKA